MAASWIPILIFTAIWGVVGGVLPLFVPNTRNKG